MADECVVVGNLDIGIPGCFISINMASSTEAIAACGESDPKPGPTIGTLSLVAYPSNTAIWTELPAKAGVNIPYIRKYDCVKDVVHFINIGQGQSYASGEAEASIKFPFKENRIVSASSTSGPTTLYTDVTQTNGYGMSYNAGPINFDTGSAGYHSFGLVAGAQFYLQNFSFDAQPGQIPTVSYSFMYSIKSR